jgi:hypothetical protein
MGIKKAVETHGPRVGLALDFDHFTAGVMAAIRADVMGQVLFTTIGANNQMAGLQRVVSTTASPSSF